METIANPFKKFDELGIYPELKRFGLPQIGRKPLYAFDLYIDGVHKSIVLRAGAPSVGETREEATEKIIKRVEYIINFAKQHSYGLLTNKDFWEGFEYFDHRTNDKKNTHEFICGLQLRKEYKELFSFIE